ncbi:hypothetical protein ACS386_12060 [Flavobacteriaceae bacterium LMO-SS05]
MKISEKPENLKVDSSIIYLSIDHLKQGTYKLQVTLKNKIVKTIKLIKK